MASLKLPRNQTAWRFPIRRLGSGPARRFPHGSSTSLCTPHWGTSAERVFIVRYSSRTRYEKYKIHNSACKNYEQLVILSRLSPATKGLKQCYRRRRGLVVNDAAGGCCWSPPYSFIYIYIHIPYFLFSGWWIVFVRMRVCACECKKHNENECCSLTLAPQTTLQCEVPAVLYAAREILSNPFLEEESRGDWDRMVFFSSLVFSPTRSEDLNTVSIRIPN